MNRGGYPPGIHEHTRGAPWNIYARVTCAACGREYYSDGAPREPLPDDMTTAPDTAHGAENSLCANCERATVCTFCGEHRDTADGETPRAVNGCTVCECDAVRCEPCDGTGKTEFTEYWKRDGSRGGRYPVTFTETCDACDGTGVEPVARCGACGSFAAAADVGTTCSMCGRR